MFSEKLSRIYTGLEERYYALLDFLDARGVPVYKYNDFLESKGMPAFPITIALIVLIIAAIYGIFFIGNMINPSVTISFQDQFNETVAGVQVSVKDAAGKAVASTKTIASGESIQLQGIAIGSKLVVSASKEGYDTAEEEVTVVKEKIPLSMQLTKQIKEIAVDLQAVDEETGDAVKGAAIQLEWQGVTRTGTTDAAGKAHFTGIPEDMPVTVKVQADGYEQVNTTKSFVENELATIELSADSAALAGITKLIVSVEDEQGTPIEGAKITIMDKSNDTVIAERTIAESETLFDVTNGTSVRLIVQKDGFLRYDSLQSGESRTLRLLEEEWPVILLKGGNKLSVIVVAGQFPLSDATVQLFDLNSNLIESAITDFAAEAEFTNLQPEQYFVTAYKIGFLPARDQVNIAETETATISLRTADLNNSAYLGISVFDSYSAAANNADLFFFEKVAGNELPLGIPPMKTDITGYAAIKPAISSTVVVHAKKDLQEGSGEKLIEANKENQMVIELSKPLTVVELQIVDKDGLPVSGTALIETVSGELLFDGNITDGRVYFDAMGNKEINLTVTTDDGQTFSQQVDIEGKETVKVTLGEQNDELAPTVNFLGIFNENDELVEGITPANFYWAKFEINWPSGLSKGGFHARIGSDDSAFVDSQPVGIVGFDATTGSYFFGKSFQPLPLPGNEAADKQNTGSAGQFNKFVELYFTQPQNTTVVRVKIKARESITADSVELHFRAWSEAGEKFYRQPADAELGNELFSSNKTALYAETTDETINVFSSDAVCEKELCASYFFVLPNGLFVERQQFTPMTEELYALEIDLKASKALDATIKLDTDKANPLLYFTGYEVDNFLDQPTTVEALSSQTDLSGQGYIDWAAGDATAQTSSNPLGFKAGEGSTETSITFTVSIAEGQGRKIRVYFRPFAAGKASIKSQAVAEAVVLNEEFNFNIEQQKFLLLSVSPEEVSVGQDFTITAIDKDNGEDVQNAVIRLQDSKGKDAAVIVGSGATRKGLQGEYFFKNSFNPGIYKAVASAAGYATAELEIVIARDGLLSIKSPITINIAKGESSKSVTAALRNTAKEEINAISYELEKESDFPEEFAVSAQIPPTISAGKDDVASISVNLELGEESSESLYGEADLIIKGMAAGNYPTKTKAKLIINYNKQLDADCLKFNTQEVLIRLIGTAGSSASEEVEIENTCETGLSFSVKVKEQEADPNLSVTVQNLQIEKDATEKMLITASNRIDRLYSMQERRHFTIALESPQLAKSIQLTVELWNPSFNLSYPPTLALWLARQAAEESSYSQMPLQPAGGMAYAQAPLQIMNNGFAPITAFRAAVEDTSYRRFGITADIRPYAIQGINLQANQALSPMRYVYAETSKAEALKEPAQGYIYFTGVVMGHQYPDLGRTMVSVNYTGTQCLKATAGQSLLFSSKKAETILEKEIKLKNECGEQIRIIGTVKPGKIGGNAFMLFPANVTLAPGQESNFALRLIGSQEMDRAVKLRAIGLLVAQGKTIESNDLDATLKLGELIATTEGKATQKISIKACETDTTKQLSFPVLSSDCAQGYCDAKQLAAYIINKADDLVKVAKDKIARAKSQTAGSSCAAPERTHCTFDEIGVSEEMFPVFVQLDLLDYGTLLQQLREKSKTELKGYDVMQQALNLEDIGNVGFRFGNIYLAKEFRGCGKYYVEIKGAVPASQGEIITDESGRNFAIAINMKQDRADTDQCLHRVENVANFLPLDEGYTLTTDTTAWPGFVQGSSEQFGELPKMFATQLFKSPEGRYAASITKSNRLVLVKGNTGQGLLKIRIEKSGSADAPKTVYAHVPDNFNAADKEMATSIANALGTFKAYAFSESDCWGEDETGQYIVMKSSKDMEKLYGKLALDGEKAIKINSQEQCIDFNVTTGAREDIQFETDFGEKTKAGIEYVAIYLKGKSEKEKSAVLLKESANGKTEKSILKKDQLKETTAEKEGKKETKFKAEAQFCVKGDNTFSLAVENIKEIKITASGNATPGRKSEQFAVSIEACGIHPYDLVKEMGKVTMEEIEKAPDKKIVAFATVGWKGAPSEIDIIAVQRAISAEAARVEAEKRYGTGAGTPTAQQPAYMEEIAWRKLGATWLGYFVPCSAMALLLNWWTFEVKGGWDIALTCAAPAAWSTKDIIKDMGSGAKAAMEFVEGVVKAVLEYIPLVGKPFGNWLFPEGEKIASVPTEQQAMEQAQDFQENMLYPGLTGASFRDITRSVSNSFDLITESSAQTAATQAADAILKDVKKTGFLKGMADNQLDLVLGGHYDSGGKFVASITPRTYATTLMPVPGSGKPLPALREKLAQKIKSNLLVDKGKAKIANKIAEASQKGFGEAGQDMVETFARAGIEPAANGGLTGNLKNQWLAKQSQYVDNLVGGQSVSGFNPAAPSTTSTVKNQVNTFTKNIKDSWKAQIEDHIKNNLGKTAEGQALLADPQFMADMSTKINNRAKLIKFAPSAELIKGEKIYDRAGRLIRETPDSFKYTATLTDNLDDIARRTIVDVQGDMRKAMVKGAIGTQAADAFATEMFKGADALVDPTKIKSLQTRSGKLKAAVKDFFSKKFLNLKNLKALSWNLIKGAGVGIAEVWAGSVGFDQYWEKFGTPPVPGAETISGDAPKIDRDGDGRFNEDPIDGKDNDGDGLIDEDYPLFASQKLRNGGTYMIVVSKDSYGGKRFNFVELQSDQQFEDMRKQLQEKNAVLWEEADCKNFREKGVEKYLGNLAPVPTKQAAAEHVIAYYDYNPLIASAALGEVSEDPRSLGDDLPEEDLMAILIIQPEKITGCNIAKQWYLPLQNEQKEATKERVRGVVECAAKVLRSATAGGAGFNEAVKKFSAETKYVGLAVQTRDIWARFKIVQPK